jgi:hypothetical protein
MRHKAIRELILKDQIKGIPNIHSISDIDINFDRSNFMCFGICILLLNQPMLEIKTILGIFRITSSYCVLMCRLQ